MTVPLEPQVIQMIHDLEKGIQPFVVKDTAKQYSLIMHDPLIKWFAEIDCKADNESILQAFYAFSNVNPLDVPVDIKFDIRKV